MNTYFLILGIFTLFGFFINTRLKAKFGKYGQMPASRGLSGEQVAEAMLSDHGLSDVKIVMANGMLSDHYNPATKTITLSEGVFKGRSIASLAVASHECGHAIQHANAYSMLQLRSNLVPIVQISTRVQQVMFFGALFGLGSGLNSSYLILALVVTFGFTALFSIVTLPVEFDASRRALKWVDQTGIANEMEYAGTKDALKWAALTYVAQALGALIMFIYFLSLYFKNKNQQ
jgi:uncharacterized protein